MAPEPDDKDWTWVLTRPCPDCGYDPATVQRAAIPALVRDAMSRFPDALRRPDAATRPTPTTWSTLEYSCHVRDVCRTFAGRVALMLDVPDGEAARFVNWDQDATALEHRYWEQDPAVVADEVVASGEEAALAFALAGPPDDSAWDRQGVRSNGSAFTVDTLGRYFLHDLYHHVWDVRG